METQSQLNCPKFSENLGKSNAKASTKKDFEWIWKLIFAFISVVSGILLNKLYLYQTLEYFQNIRDGSVWDLIIYGIPFGAIFTLFDLAYHYMFDDLCEEYYMDCSKFPEEKSRKNRAYSLVKWSYSIVYYLISSIWAYQLLKNTSYFPPYLGGINPQGGFHTFLSDLPRQLQITFSMKVFYILQFGKHFSRLINHCFIRHEGNFFEYTLHHGLSTFLIVFSYLMNMWMIGVWVLLIHDFTQCWLILGRGYDSYKYKKNIITYLTYAIGACFWIPGRIVLFLTSLVYTPIQRMLTFGEPILQKSQIQYEILRFPIYFMIFMLICLYVMQLYWTYYIFVGILKRTLLKNIKSFYE